MVRFHDFHPLITWATALFVILIAALGLGFWLFANAQGGGDGAIANSSDAQQKGLVSATALWIVTTALLLLVLASGLFLLRRWGKRLKTGAASRKPTDASDAWAMHQLPEDFESPLDADGD
jgi:hypothetical protein